jgi:hypothetical protein
VPRSKKMLLPRPNWLVAVPMCLPLAFLTRRRLLGVPPMGGSAVTLHLAGDSILRIGREQTTARGMQNLKTALLTPAMSLRGFRSFPPDLMNVVGHRGAPYSV